MDEIIKEIIPQEDEYIVTVDCRNCGMDRRNMTVKKGTTIEKYLSHKKCPVCGCDKYLRKSYRN